MIYDVLTFPNVASWPPDPAVFSDPGGVNALAAAWISPDLIRMTGDLANDAISVALVAPPILNLVPPIPSTPIIFQFGFTFKGFTGVGAIASMGTSFIGHVFDFNLSPNTPAVSITLDSSTPTFILPSLTPSDEFLFVLTIEPATLIGVAEIFQNGSLVLSGLQSIAPIGNGPIAQQFNVGPTAVGSTFDFGDLQFTTSLGTASKGNERVALLDPIVVSPLEVEHDKKTWKGLF